MCTLLLFSCCAERTGITLAQLHGISLILVPQLSSCLCHLATELALLHYSLGLAYEGLLLTSSFPSPFLSHLLKAAQAALFCNPFFPMSWISNYIICSSDLRYHCLSPVSPFVSFTWQMWSLWLSAAAVATPGKSCAASEETCSQKVVWLLFNYFQNQVWIWSEWGNQKLWVLMVLAIGICQHCRLFACFAQSRLA